MKKIIRPYLVIAWIFFILKLVFYPFPESDYHVEGISDKFIHVFFFFVLVMLIAYNKDKKKIKLSVLVFAFLFSLFFSAFIEHIQKFISGRDSSLYDLLAGIIGALMAVIFLIYRKYKKPKLLLHICCAGCGAYVSKELKKDYKVSLYFYNPNIFPKKEYKIREEEAVKIAKKNKIKLYKEKYNHNSWLRLIKGREKDKERGRRCAICYKDRLKKTVLFAKNNKFDFFTTTLSVSPHKDAKEIIKIGKELEKKYRVVFLEKDFKKRDGFKKASALSKKLNLYRQDYCGCEFSKIE
jgi:predicted adenine nucleotide alpha hydrolase (AANH) superfamily ATPase/VanZ family protein